MTKISLYQCVIIVAKRVVISLINAINVRLQLIATRHVKRSTDTNIKKNARKFSDVLPRSTEINDEVAAHAAKLHDLALFKEPPPSQYGDCPICFLQMPLLNSGHRYKGCCGKVICVGCAHAPVYDHLGIIVTKKVCPFCRTPAPETDEEANERDMVRVEAGDPIAIQDLGYNYREGTDGRPQDYTKAFGDANALKKIKMYYKYGYATKVDYMTALQSYQAFLGEIKSKQRDEAAAADDQYRYY